jgi:hypothetical protein
VWVRQSEPNRSSDEELMLSPCERAFESHML